MPRIFLPPTALIRCFSSSNTSLSVAGNDNSRVQLASHSAWLLYIPLCFVPSIILSWENANHCQLQDAKSKAPSFKPRCTHRLCLSQPQRQLALSKRKLLLL